MRGTTILSTRRPTERILKRSDIMVISIALSVVSFFALVPDALAAFKYCSKEYSYVMSFVKFAILATFGECLALRITSGCYNRTGFGILPKMIIWGMLGIIIKIAFVIFVTGTPYVLQSLGVNTIQPESFGLKMLSAFSISVCLNLIFAPVMMTLHKITDMHIQEFKGELTALTNPIDLATILTKIDWQVMYHFVFKKTIPFFWIPAHTITFLLPEEYQILFAATLGIALGLILAFAAMKNSSMASTN